MSVLQSEQSPEELLAIAFPCFSHSISTRCFLRAPRLRNVNVGRVEIGEESGSHGDSKGSFRQIILYDESLSRFFVRRREEILSRAFISWSWISRSKTGEIGGRRHRYFLITVLVNIGSSGDHARAVARFESINGILYVASKT